MRPTYFVNNEAVVHVASQQRWAKTGNNWNGLAQAIKLSEPGDTIGFVGAHEAIRIGGGGLWEPSSAFWANGPVHGIRIYGLSQTESKIIGGVSFMDEFGAPHSIQIDNCTVVVNDMRCMITYQHSGPYLRLSFKDLLFDVSPENFPGGMMYNDWIFRFHGPAQFNVESCRQLQPNKMHFVYADNVQGDSFVRNCVANGNGRTMVQIVNRIASGPVSKGNILVERCLVTGPGHLDGASAFTCSGHLNGTITFKNCHAKECLGGGIVAWGEGGLYGSHRNEDGKAIDHIIVQDCSIQATQADRDALAFSSCSQVSCGRIKVQSNRIGMRIDAVQNEAVTAFRFTDPNPSQWEWLTPTKVVRGYTHTMSHTLTDEEIDALYQSAGVED